MKKNKSTKYESVRLRAEAHFGAQVRMYESVIKHFLISAIFFLIAEIGVSQTILLQENFTAYTGTAGTAPAGWYFSYYGAYTSTLNSGVSGPNSCKFGVNNATVITPSFTNADSVKFWLRILSSTDTASYLTVYETADSITWTSIVKIKPVPNTGTTLAYPVNNTSIHLKFVYTKVASNIAFDDFLLSGTSSSSSSSGTMTVYFNTPVDNSVSSGVNAIYLNNSMADTLAAYISRAKYSIDVAQYNYSQSTTITTVTNALNAAYANGINIRWIYDGSQSNTGLANLNAGIQTLASPTTASYGIMHNKFMIIDGKSSNANDALVWTGSPDWSKTQFDSCHNNIIVIQDSALAHAYTAEFEQMWGDTGLTPNSTNSKFGPFKTDLGQHNFTIGGRAVELYFSPADGTNSHILPAISSANTDLYFGVYTFTYQTDADSIVAKKNAGVYTAGIVDQYSNTSAAYTTLSSGLGSNLETFASSSIVYHNKYLIVDPSDFCSDPLVLTGSHNWTFSADTKNDENTLIIHDDTIANIYYQAFHQNFTDLGGTLTAITNCATLSATTSATNATCKGSCDGSATVTATGGTTPYSYLWSNGATSATLSGLCAGTYTVTVTGGTSGTASVTISQPSAIIATTSSTNTVCGASSGTATVNAGGGTSPYTYLWSDSQTTQTATGLSGGNYSVTVTDSAGCTKTATANVLSSGGATTTVTSTNDSCNGANNGTATVSATGGTTPYSYLWSNGSATLTVNGLGAGTYFVTVTDSNNCSAIDSAIITQPSPLSLTFIKTNVTCNGDSTGALDLIVSGGTSAYSYLWSNGATSASLSGLSSGTYHVTVTDANGCTKTGFRTIFQPTPINVTTGSTNASCGNSDGTATANANGGNSPYTYLWNDSAASTAATATGLFAGSYSVTVTDTSGCTSSAIASVNNAGAPTITLDSASTLNCSYDCNGTATVSANGGVSPYTFLWSDGQPNYAATSLCAGTYIVSVTDSVGCSSNLSVIINAPAAISLSEFSFNINCNGNCDGYVVVIPSGGTSTYTYNWSPNPGAGQGTASASQLCVGNYSLVVTDVKNCIAVDSFNITEPAALSSSITSSPSVNSACNGSATVSASGGTAPYTYLWSDSSVTATASNLCSGNYSVVITDANGCTDTVFATVADSLTGISENNFIGELKIFPNPTGGKFTISIPSSVIRHLSSVLIYNLIGEKIYSTQLTQSTQLTINLSDQPDGIYFLYIKTENVIATKKLILNK